MRGYGNNVHGGVYGVHGGVYYVRVARHGRACMHARTSGGAAACAASLTVTRAVRCCCMASLGDDALLPGRCAWLTACGHKAHCCSTTHVTMLCALLCRTSRRAALAVLCCKPSSCKTCKTSYDDPVLCCRTSPRAARRCRCWGTATTTSASSSRPPTCERARKAKGGGRQWGPSGRRARVGVGVRTTSGGKVVNVMCMCNLMACACAT